MIWRELEKPVAFVLGGGGLVADHHAVLVGPHLRSPHPEGAADNDGIRLTYLGDLQPRAMDRLARRMCARRVPLEDLRLVGITVRVLAKEHPAG